MLLLESDDRLFLDAGDRFPVGRLDNDGAADGAGLLGLFWRAAVGGSAPERVTCGIEELETPEPEFSTEASPAGVLLRASAVGAARMAAFDAENGGALLAEAEIADAGQVALPLTEGRNVFRLRAAVYNTRGSELAREITVAAPSAPIRFFAVKDPFPLKIFEPTESLSFAARLAACGGRLLRRDEVRLCRCTVLRLVKNSRGVGRVPCHTRFGEGVEVPLDVFVDTLSAAAPWRRDRIGGNFRWTPGVTLDEMCGGAGIYDVIFTVVLVGGRSIEFEFSIPVGRRRNRRRFPFCPY